MSESSNLFDSENDENLNSSFPESQGDALLLEVQDAMKNSQGCATIPISSLTDNPVSVLYNWTDCYQDILFSTITLLILTELL